MVFDCLLFKGIFPYLQTCCQTAFFILCDRPAVRHHDVFMLTDRPAVRDHVIMLTDRPAVRDHDVFVLFDTKMTDLLSETMLYADWQTCCHTMSVCWLTDLLPDYVFMLTVWQTCCETLMSFYWLTDLSETLMFLCWLFDRPAVRHWCFCTNCLTDLLSEIVMSAPLFMLESMGKVREVFDYLTLLPPDTAQGLLVALLPLLKVSMSLKDTLILLLRKSIFSRWD